MKLNNKVLSTLSYLSSLLDEETELVLSLKGKTVNHLDKESGKIVAIALSESNPIGYLLIKAVGDMCTDCFKDDESFKSPFFVELMKLYLCALEHEFGSKIPVTRTLAQRILQYELSKGDIMIQGNIDHTYTKNPNSDFFKDTKSTASLKYYLVI